MLNKQEEIEEQKKSNVGLISLRKDDIITFEPIDGIFEHQLKDMKWELEQFILWSEKKKKKLPFLSDNRNLKKFDIEIRNYAKNNINKFASKFAFLVNSGISSFLTNTFIHLHRPEIPIKVFTHKEAAISWLKSH